MAATSAASIWMASRRWIGPQCTTAQCMQPRRVEQLSSSRPMSEWTLMMTKSVGCWQEQRFSHRMTEFQDDQTLGFDLLAHKNDVIALRVVLCTAKASTTRSHSASSITYA